MAGVTKEQVLDQLKTVTGPDFNSNIVDLGLVSDIFIAVEIRPGRRTSPRRSAPPWP